MASVSLAILLTGVAWCGALGSRPPRASSPCLGNASCAVTDLELVRLDIIDWDDDVIEVDDGEKEAEEDERRPSLPGSHRLRAARPLSTIRQKERRSRPQRLLPVDGHAAGRREENVSAATKCHDLHELLAHPTDVKLMSDVLDYLCSSSSAMLSAPGSLLSGCLYLSDDYSVYRLYDILEFPAPEMFDHMFENSFFFLDEHGQCPHEAGSVGEHVAAGGAVVETCSVGAAVGFEAYSEKGTTCETNVQLVGRVEALALSVYSVKSLVGVPEDLVASSALAESILAGGAMNATTPGMPNDIEGVPAARRQEARWYPSNSSVVTFPIDFILCNADYVQEAQLDVQVDIINSAYGGRDTCRKELYPFQKVNTQIQFVRGNTSRVHDPDCDNDGCTTNYLITGRQMIKTYAPLEPGRIKIFVCHGEEGSLGQGALPWIRTMYGPNYEMQHGAWIQARTLPGGGLRAHEGATLVHELGHYFGLHHPFKGGCGSNAGGTVNDFEYHEQVLDTNLQASPIFGSPDRLSTSCDSVDPIHNYMGYADADQVCSFTEGQKMRMWYAMQLFMHEDLQLLLGDEKIHSTCPDDSVCWECVKSVDSSCFKPTGGSDVFTTIHCADICTNQCLLPCTGKTHAPTPAPVCLDKIPSGKVEWHYWGSAQWNCGRFAISTNCERYGWASSDSGMRADEACCACGGGIPQERSEASEASEAPDVAQVQSHQVVASEASDASKAPTSAPTSSPTRAPTSSPTRAPTSEPTGAPARAPTGADQQATASDDPHMVNLAGEHFDVNQPGVHVLLRVPSDQAAPALLELRAAVQRPDDGRMCAMYIGAATVQGLWMGETVAEVRPLRRNKAGSNTAGSSTLQPFSIRLSNASGEGAWRQLADFTLVDARAETLSEKVKVVATQDTEGYKSHLEGQMFRFEIGQPTKWHATITVSQGLHQALNVQVANLYAVGHAEIGGLLGTQRHDAAVEELTYECKAEKSAATGSDLRSPRHTESERRSMAVASWH